MKDELDKQLCEKYPKIFRDRNATMYESCMHWGLSVGDGWFNILDATCANIQGHINQTRKQRANALKFNRVLKRAIAGDKNGLEHYHTYNGRLCDWGQKQVAEDIKAATFRPVPEACPQVVASQVKEKFGGLRFYYSGGDTFCDGVISMAESMAYLTCEECGTPGETRPGGWVRVLCDVHHAEVEAKRKEHFGDDDDVIEDELNTNE